MLEASSLVAFVASTDLERSRRFYVGALGLAVLESTPHALEVDANGTELRITRIAELVRAPYTVLGWSVEDLDSSVAELRGAGVRFCRYEGLAQDEYDAWTAPDGTRVAWFEDPDGNVLSLHHKHVAATSTQSRP
jgi:catechol 2,3-dioxygenase-like lactoylglutathione lyase family enzyme